MNGQLPEVPDVQQVINFAENALGLQIEHSELAQTAKTSSGSRTQPVLAPAAQPTSPNVSTPSGISENSKNITGHKMAVSL